MNEVLIQRTISVIQQGGIIAYPTEAVYGLGCDPNQAQAVHRLLEIKQRPMEKGLILIAAAWDDVVQYVDVDNVPVQCMQTILAQWPGPYTWLFPAKSHVAHCLTGGTGKIAIRLTAHPVAKTLCQWAGQAIVSTSANLAGQPPLTTYQAVQQVLGSSIDEIIAGAVGDLDKPTPIWDVITGDVVRHA